MLLRTLIRKIYNKVWKIFGFRRRKLPTIRYWQERARQYGERAVFNIGHTEDEMESINRMQKDKIFPLFRKQLNGRERILLDLGCGTGRFTADLAQLIKGKTIGIDTIEDFIDLAKKNKVIGNFEYRLMSEGVIPMEDSSVDIVWICLVLGGIIEDAILRSTISEIKRVLKKDGLIFLIENTTGNKKNGDYWKFRSVENYQCLLNFANLKHLSEYFDLGEKISIMAGRKNV